MVKVLVIADDFTGANDTGALLRQKGLRTFSTYRDEISEEIRNTYEAVCLSTDSRSMDQWDARACVRRVAESYREEGVLISKRIDSTLRGNIGKEIEGVLDAVPAGWKAVVVPVSPRAGRVCVDGCILVHGVPLAESDAARDPRTPVGESKAADIIRRQTERTVGHISLECVHRKSEAIAGKLRELETPIIVVDAVDMNDIREIARGCVESGIDMICVDPGDFTLEMVSLGSRNSREKNRKNLLVVGSLSPAAREQLDYMKECGDICLYQIDLGILLGESDREMEKAKQFLMKEGAGEKNLCITTAYSERISVKSDSESGKAFAERIADAIAKLALALKSEEGLQIGLVYLSGGDIAKAFAGKAGVEGVEPLGELSPLAVYGTMVGGAVAGMKVLTKGGMIGGKDTLHKMLSCVEIINAINQQEGKE